METNPNDGDALLLASQIKESFGEYENAEKFARRAVDREPHNAEYHAQLARSYAMLAESSSLLKQVNYVRLLRRELEATYRLNAKQLDAHLVEMMYTFKAPRLAGGDKERSHAIARELLKIDPQWGYLAEAKLAGEENNETVAEQSLLKAVQVNPTVYRVHAELGNFYIARSSHPRPELAEREAREALKIDAGRSAAYEILAEVYTYQQRWQDLDAILGEAERKVPDDASPYYRSAYLLFSEGRDFPRAARYLRKYLGQTPEGRQPMLADARRLLAKVNSHS